MSREQISALIRTNIIEACPPESRDVYFTSSSPLVATGILDSVGVFTLVAFLEERFDVEVTDDELDWKNFETVDAITRLVESKLAAAGRSEIDLQ